jgi:hypothetical protein
MRAVTDRFHSGDELALCFIRQALGRVFLAQLVRRHSELGVIRNRRRRSLWRHGGRVRADLVPEPRHAVVVTPQSAVLSATCVHSTTLASADSAKQIPLTDMPATSARHAWSASVVFIVFP